MLRNLSLFNRTLPALLLALLPLASHAGDFNLSINSP